MRGSGAGLALGPRRAYLMSMAFLPRPASPKGFLADIKGVFFARHRHGLLFAAASIITTIVIAALFLGDFKHEKPWKRDVQYVENWEADRSDAIIKAQQKIDQAKRDLAEGEREIKRIEQRDQYKKLQKEMQSIGIGR